MGPFTSPSGSATPRARFPLVPAAFPRRSSPGVSAPGPPFPGLPPELLGWPSSPCPRQFAPGETPDSRSRKRSGIPSTAFRRPRYGLPAARPRSARSRPAPLGKQDRSSLLPDAAARLAPPRPAPLPPPACGCACSLPPVRSTGAPVAPGASAPPAALPCAPAPSLPARCSRIPVPPAVQSPVCRCLPYTSQSLARAQWDKALPCPSERSSDFFPVLRCLRSPPRGTVESLVFLFRSLRVFLRVSASNPMPQAPAAPSSYPASISSATRFLISCRASHRYLNASFLNTCFFSVSEAIRSEEHTSELQSLRHLVC